MRDAGGRGVGRGGSAETALNWDGQSPPAVPRGGEPRARAPAPPDVRETVPMEFSGMWVVLFALPVVAIVVIIGFARYQASEVQQDERDDRPPADD